MKRTILLIILGMFCLLLCVASGILAIGFVGGMSAGGSMLRGTLLCIGCGFLTVQFGKLGYALLDYALFDI